MTSLGELMSEMCARIMLRAKLAEDSNDESFISDANLVMKMNQAIQQGKPQEAMQYYDQLGNLKKDRIVQVTRLQVVSGLDDVKLLDQVCSEFLERFPNDIAGDLFMIDAYITMDQYDKALAAVDRIDRNVGGDPYLCLIRGNLKSMQGDRAAAQAELLKGIEADPTLTDIANALADHALQDNDFAALKRWLLHLEKYCNYEFNDDLNNAAEFEAFKKSAEYQAWLKEKKP